MTVIVGELVSVLEADSSNLEEGFKKAGQATKDYEEKQRTASLATMETLARQEALLSSLNQVTGGYGKVIGSLQKLNWVTEEQFIWLEKSRAAMEMIAGPIEVYIALKKAKVALEAKDTKASKGSTVATKAQTGAMARLNAVMYANPLVFIIALVVVLVASLYMLEKKFGAVTYLVEELTKVFNSWKEGIDGITASVTGLGDKMGIIGDIGDKMTGFVGSIT
tara:strand:- start:1373 stop:2038 length:666 start_codon:yes stop_codon:yes gene_type:complete